MQLKKNIFPKSYHKYKAFKKHFSNAVTIHTKKLDHLSLILQPVFKIPPFIAALLFQQLITTHK
jgi:hypothetical protein